MMDKAAILQTINSLKEQIGQLETAITGDGSEGEDQMPPEGIEGEMEGGGMPEGDIGMGMPPKAKSPGGMPDMLKKYMS